MCSLLVLRLCNCRIQVVLHEVKWYLHWIGLNFNPCLVPAMILKVNEITIYSYSKCNDKTHYYTAQTETKTPLQTRFWDWIAGCLKRISNSPLGWGSSAQFLNNELLFPNKISPAGTIRSRRLFHSLESNISPNFRLRVWKSVHTMAY